MGADGRLPSPDPRLEPLLRRDLAFPRVVLPSRDRSGAGALVTGANSYVGLHVLRELLDAWQGPIHALLRARDEAHARRRLLEGGLRWGIDLSDLDRVRVHAGEVTVAGWRLDPDVRDRLDDEVDTVLHLALLARYDVPWSVYRATWLPELARMVEWCGASRRPKSLHYPGSYNTHFLREDEDFARIGETAWTSGYTAFKWVAEGVLRRAFGGNLSGAYYDVPLVLGSAARGLCPRTYSAIIVIDAFLRAGAGLDVGALRVVPADFLARVIVHNARLGSAEATPYVRPVLPGAVGFDELARALGDQGIRLGKLDREAFLSRLADQRRFVEFFLPDGVARLVTEAHRPPALLPPTFDASGAPDVMDVVRANCRRVFASVG